MIPSQSPAPRDGAFMGVRHSVRKKLMLVVLATTFLALLLMGTVMMVYDLRTYHETWVGDMFAQADLIGRASAPALAFDDEKVARENLSLLQERPKVSAAAIYAADGKLFATYWRSDGSPPVFPAHPDHEGYRIESKELILFKRITGNDEFLGTVYFRTSYELLDRLLGYLAILAAVMATSLGAAMLVTSWLHRGVTEPILAMTGVARKVMSQRDFSLRVGKLTDDEIGYLVDTFNAMLEEIGRRTRALEESNRTLEQEMAVRRHAEKALLAADRQKDEFLATLAHELRNPLAPLLNALEILRMPAATESAGRAARDMMERQLRQLVQLVNDLLDVSRITTGKMALRKERCGLDGIVRIALESAQPLMDARRHSLEVVLPQAQVHLFADASRLAQVFVNLLNNAAKFTDPGGRISFVARRNADLLEVTVTDNGMGMAAGMLPLVFDMFAQADRSLERAEAGLGVGLSLARYLVEAHGGSIAAHSAGAGMGSRFTVQLPILPEADAGKPSPPQDRHAHTGRFRILLADDNVDFAASLSILLEAAGHEVAMAHDGVQALDAARGFRPDLCFLDIGLPRLHGYDLARKLRELAATKHACLVAISGWGQPEDKRRSREAGFDHHLAKPVDFEQIRQLLEQVQASRRAS